jgi:hypothetical protein
MLIGLRCADQADLRAEVDRICRIGYFESAPLAGYNRLNLIAAGGLL